jgi:hypothetical protein
VLSPALGYSSLMGMGSLAKYRKIFMISAFLIFALGAIGRWHSKRQRSAVEQKSHLVNTPSESWQSDCVSYACRVLPARTDECKAICEQAIAKGPPKTLAERMANACKKFCAAESTPTRTCAADCLIREAQLSAQQR